MFEIVVRESRIPATSLKLIYCGRVILPKVEDTEPVAAKYKLEEGSVVHCMGKPVEGDLVAPTSVATLATSAPAVSDPTVTSAATSSFQAVDAAPAVNELLHDLHKLQLEGCANVSATYLTALKTLLKVIDNIIQNPLEEKYRVLKCSNAAFLKRLGGLKGSDAVLMKCGFRKTPDNYILDPSAEKWELLQTARVIVLGEINRISAQQQSPLPATVAGSPFGNVDVGPSASSIGTMGGSMPPMPPGMDMNMMQNMLSDPNALSSMLSNPMVQQAVENDPRFAGNPQLRQGLRAIQNNPGMLDQISRMMSDPTMRQRMEGMMRQPGASTPAPATQQQQPPVDMHSMQQAMAGIARMAQQQQLQQGAGTNSGAMQSGMARTDDEMTEEEMIAQAIERSLREQ